MCEPTPAQQRDYQRQLVHRPESLVLLCVREILKPACQRLMGACRVRCGAHLDGLVCVLGHLAPLAVPPSVGLLQLLLGRLSQAHSFLFGVAQRRLQLHNQLPTNGDGISLSASAGLGSARRREGALLRACFYGMADGDVCINNHLETRLSQTRAPFFFSRHETEGRTEKRQKKKK